MHRDHGWGRDCAPRGKFNGPEGLQATAQLGGHVGSQRPFEGAGNRV